MMLKFLSERSLHREPFSAISRCIRLSQGMKVFISSCETGESFYGRELKRMAGLCTSLQSVFVDRPEDADLILVVDMDEADVFANLRRNHVWRRFPEKSFGIYEGDNPPRFLHGLYSSVPPVLDAHGPIPILRLPNAPDLFSERSSRCFNGQRNSERPAVFLCRTT